ncbi:MAG TPA: hypothetical protein VF635_11550, partial [Propionibacteriaceae bacterium]
DRRVTWLAAAVFVPTTALTIYGAHHRWEIAIVMGGVAVALLVVYRYLLPNRLAGGPAGGTALLLSVLAIVLLLPAFWSGQSLILGVAGVVLGLHSRQASTHRGKAVAAIVLGSVASVGYFAIYVMDAILPPGTA